MHPLAGNWIANIEQSRRDPNHQFSQATIRFEIADEAVSLTYGGVNASGRQEQGAQKLVADGQEYPLAGAPGVVVITTLDSRALHTAASKAGATMGQATYEAAEDGKTMTATVSGIDAKGAAFDQVIVFDREQPTLN